MTYLLVSRLRNCFTTCLFDLYILLGFLPHFSDSFVQKLFPRTGFLLSGFDFPASSKALGTELPILLSFRVLNPAWSMGDSIAVLDYGCLRPFHRDHLARRSFVFFLSLFQTRVCYSSSDENTQGSRSSCMIDFLHYTSRHRFFIACFPFRRWGVLRVIRSTYSEIVGLWRSVCSVQFLTMLFKAASHALGVGHWAVSFCSCALCH